MSTDLYAGEQIVSAKVVRTIDTFDAEGKPIKYKRGDVLTGEQVAKIKNIKAMIDVPYLIPRYGAQQERGARFIIKEKDGYTVIEGRKINDKPLTREAAQDLLDQTS